MSDESNEKDLEEKMKVYNFEALKGSIEVHPVFRGAVKTFRKLASTNPKTFKELNETYQEQADEKREDLGVLNMTPEQLLDSIIQDINRLPREKRKKYLDELASIHERKRAIEAAMLTAIQQREFAAPPPGSAKSLVDSGQLSDKDIKEVTQELKDSQTKLRRRVSEGWEKVVEATKTIEPKRTLQ